MFRLLANELTSLVQRVAAEALRENAQLLWGNRSLIVQAEEVHAVVLGRWPSLGQQRAALRISLAAYGDAIEAAAGRLIEQAGTTRALGFLPAETWVSFARRSDVQALAAVLDSFVFDAPAPWLSPQALAEAEESARQCGLWSAPMRTRSRVSMPSPDPGAGWCSSSTREGPYLRAKPAQIRPADSVREMMPPVSVTTAR